MRPYIRWLAASLSFFCPTVVAMVAKHLDHSSFRHDSRYTTLIPFAVLGSLILAVLGPVLLIVRMQATLSVRVVLVALVGCLLLVQLYWLFFSIVITP